MSAPISIVIPTLNAEKSLPDLFTSLMPAVVEGVIKEVIVVDAGSTDQTTLIAKDAGAVILEHSPSRGGQLKKGIAAAQGDWIFALHADSVLDPNWSILWREVADAETAFYGTLVYNAKGVGPLVVAGWANLRSRVFGLPYGDQGLLLHRALYNKVGGYRDQPLMEDVEIARSLKGHLRPLGCSVHTSFAKYERGFWIRRGAANLFLLLRYLLGADAVKLSQLYRRF